MIILFLGPSGSGKDTQAEKLVSKHGFQMYSSGDLFRTEIKKQSPLAEELQTYLTSGKWVPNDLYYKIMVEGFKTIDFSRNTILNGFIRAEGQPELLSQALADRDAKLDLAIHFDLSTEIAIARLSTRLYCPKCQTTYDTKYKIPKIEGLCDKDNEKLIQRPDDTPAAIKSRMDEYQKNIAPIIEFYTKLGIMKHINASLGIKEIHQNIIELLSL